MNISGNFLATQFIYTARHGYAKHIDKWLKTVVFRSINV